MEIVDNWIEKSTDVEHCSHCAPVFWWVQNQEGKPPQFAFRGFPTRGQVILSKAKVIVVCEACVDGLTRNLSRGVGLIQ